MSTLASTEEATAGVGSRRLVWLWVATAAAVAAHNLEEGLANMTGWIAGHPWLPGSSLHGDSTQFALVLAVVAAAVIAIAAVAAVAQPAWSGGVLVCVAYALMVNAGSHLALSVLTWSVMPGLVTGLVVLLPLGRYVVRVLPAVRWTAATVAATVGAAVGITAGAFALGALAGGLG